MKIPGSTTDLGEGEHDTPHLTLIPETILADDLKFRVPVAGRLVRSHRHEQRQARAQWPGDTNKRAASKALRSQRLCRPLQQMTYDDEAPCTSCCTNVVPSLLRRMD